MHHKCLIISKVWRWQRRLTGKIALFIFFQCLRKISCLRKIRQILNILFWKLSNKWQNGLSWAYISCEIDISPPSIFQSKDILSWLEINFNECKPVYTKRVHCVLQFKPWSFPVPLNLLSGAKCGKCSINTCRYLRPTCTDQSWIVRFYFFTKLLKFQNMLFLCQKQQILKCHLRWM